MLKSPRAAITLSMLLTLYALGFTNLFLRGSLGILGPELTTEMNLTPELLSAVASSFFFAYAALQIPTGMFLDRFGPRATLSTMLVATTAGAALFAVAQSASGLIAARVLMGIGCAGIFTGAFFVLNRWVPPHQVVTQSGLMNSMASLGGLCATTPLAALIAVIGWREAYWIFTAGVVVLLVMVVAFIRDAPPNEPASTDARPAGGQRETLAGVFRGVVEAVRQPGMKQLLVVGIPLSAQSTLLGAWAAPYLRDVHGLDSIARGNVLLSMAICSMFGHVIYGAIARSLNSIKWVVIGGMTLIVLATAALALVPSPGVGMVTALFATISIAAMYPMMAFAHARSLVPPHLVGRGLAVTNMGIMTAIAVSQMLFGYVVGQFDVVGTASPEIAYQTAFAVLSCLSALAALVYLPVPDARPRA